MQRRVTVAWLQKEPLHILTICDRRADLGGHFRLGIAISSGLGNFVESHLVLPTSHCFGTRKLTRLFWKGSKIVFSYLRSAFTLYFHERRFTTRDVPSAQPFHVLKRTMTTRPENKGKSLGLIPFSEMPKVDVHPHGHELQWKRAVKYISASRARRVPGLFSPPPHGLH
ncbi:hypothetical protein NEUTE2DRAFT_131084 [Neurospora tetrasperma FGSC 2509]|nr:hypothetical protein NEUTE2DRAFT_131084 [Neurospora tetrasperma FGSC 2509]